MPQLLGLWTGTMLGVAGTVSVIELARGSAVWWPVFAGLAAVGVVGLARERSVRATVVRQRDLLAIASHDLRTPLATLQMQVHRLGRGATDGETVRRMESTLGRMQALVDDLLDAARAEDGRLSYERRTVDYALVVRGVVDRLAPQAEEAGSVIELVVPDRLVGPWDVVRLEQVVTNLVGNALKYGAGKPVRIALEEHADSARLLVTDAGRGLTPIDTRRLFRRWGRLGRGSSEGAGLGLWIARHVVNAMKGSIRCESAGPGLGCTFVVDLPLR